MTSDARADIYSLGCTMYYLLTGRAPFCQGGFVARLIMHQTIAPPSLYEFRPEIPPPLVAACQRMMEKRPEDRFQSCAEVALAMQCWRARVSESNEVLSG